MAATTWLLSSIVRLSGSSIVAGYHKASHAIFGNPRAARDEGCGSDLQEQAVKYEERSK
jgi:hypothetical protein